MKKEKNELFLVCTVIADRLRRKLLITEETVENLHNMTYYTTTMYFQYKKRYPDYEEVIIPNFEKISLGIEIE